MDIIDTLWLCVGLDSDCRYCAAAPFYEYLCDGRGFGCLAGKSGDPFIFLLKAPQISN